MRLSGFESGVGEVIQLSGIILSPFSCQFGVYLHDHGSVCMTHPGLERLDRDTGFIAGSTVGYPEIMATDPDILPRWKCLPCLEELFVLFCFPIPTPMTSAVNVPTVSQRPDNVLRLEKKGAETDYEYVFDAKYRINPSAEGTDYHLTISKTPGPEVDDINTMHRYRDAIVYHNGASPFERMMFGAYVLFPYKNEDEYRQHRFYQSIDQVNIGGLPFLPSATGLVTDMLDDLIDDSPESAFERATLPKGIESKLKKVDWNRRDVLVGAVRSQEQLEACMEHRFYYVPVRMLAQENLPIHEVALYQSKGLFGREAGIEYYGEVLSVEKVKRNEITEILRDSDELYYRLNIHKWVSLGRRIEAKEYGIRSYAFTNHFLLKHSISVPELFLKTEEEYRFLTELKRVSGNAALINDDRGMGFGFGDYRVLFEDGEIELFNKEKRLASCKINSFVKRPNAEFRALMRAMKE